MKTFAFVRSAFAALAVPLLASGAVTSAFADGGRGGNGSDNFGLGGAGGSNGQPPNTGGTGQFSNGGGGGGGGFAGGNSGAAGGASADGEAGGLGATTSGAPNGAAGTGGVSGGGGGGGYGGEHGSTQSVLSGVVAGDNGGTGGAGGNGTNGGGGGGGGGNGGYGAVVSADGTNTGAVSGGQGGSGGVGGVSGASSGGNGGYGGDGGIGIQFTAPGTVFTNTGTISGGNGGIAGLGGAGTFAGSSGMTGNGGIGITGADLTIDNTGGTISGGLANGGFGAQARGVHFTGGTNAIGGGTVNGDILVSNNSSFAPTLSSSAIGTGSPVVNGSIVFTPNTNYLIRVSPTVSDSLTVTGNAQLFGARVNAQFQPGTYINRQYTIITAASGLNFQTFAGLDSNNLPNNTTASLSYTATSVLLDLVLDFTPPPATPGYSPPPALTRNQQNVANALVNYFNTTGGIPMSFATLTTDQLSQVAGETAVGAQQATFSAMNQFMGMLGDRTSNGRGENQNAQAVSFADPAMAYASSRRRSGAQAAIDRNMPAKPAPFQARWSVWAGGFGGSQKTDGNTAQGSSDTMSRAYGVAAGADYRFTPDTVAGFALAGGGTNFSVGNAGSGHSDLFQAGGFVRHSMGPAYVTAALAYAWQDVTTERSLGADRLQGRFNANAFSGRLEGGYRFATPLMGIAPYAAAQFTSLALPGYGETALAGTGTFALAYASKNVTATRTELGLRTDKSFALDKSMLTLRGRAAWAHDSNTDRTLAATFQTLPGASFVTNGAAQPPHAALVSASAELKFRNNWSIAATFDGEFASTSISYAGRGALRYAW